MEEKPQHKETFIKRFIWVILVGILSISLTYLSYAQMVNEAPITISYLPMPITLFVSWGRLNVSASVSYYFYIHFVSHHILKI